LHVGMAQAALGTQLEVETLEEPHQVEVLAGTQSGHVVRLKGLGIPHLRGRGRGDLLVHVLVDTPRDLTPKQEELLSQLASERGEVIDPPGGRDGVFSRIRSAFG